MECCCSTTLVLGLVAAYVVLSLLRKYVRVNIGNKAVVITGCDTGFGNMTAKQLDKMGIKVFAGCLTAAGAQALKKECSSRLVAFDMDVANEESVKAAAELVQKSLASDDNCDGIWGLINNAGIVGGFCVDLTDIKTYKKVMDVNCFGTINVTKAFLPFLKRTKGRIVNITSVAGRISSGGMSAYSASKYAAEAFSDALRQEMRPFGVQVAIVEPGFMKTALTATWEEKLMQAWNTAPVATREEYGNEFLQSVKAGLSKNIGMFAGNPEQVVNVLIEATLAKFPFNRYVVGWDAIMMWAPLSLCPAAVVDFIVRLAGDTEEPKACKPKK